MQQSTWIFCLLCIFPWHLSDATLKKRIIGGSLAPADKFPWAVTIRGEVPNEDSSTVCGATIISEEWLVTAAHCFFTADENGKTIALTNPALWHIIAGQVLVEIDEYMVGHDAKNASRKLHSHLQKVVVHDKYDDENIEWDIALIKLSKPLPLKKLPGIQAMPLPPVNSSPWRKLPSDGEKCVVVGWGCKIAGGDPSNRAKYANLNVVSHKKCNQAYENAAGLNVDHEFCAGFIKANIGVCPGDSGSGLICTFRNAQYVAGVTSATHGERPEHFPGLFTRVSYFHSWILSVMKKN